MEEHVKTSEVDFNQSENRFSILKWFKRCRDRVISSNSRISSCESVESGESTETTNSFIVYFRTSLISGKFRATKDYQQSLNAESKVTNDEKPLKRTENRKYHVKGKRRAPNPPGTVSKPQTIEKVTEKSKKKRRPAPKPPRDTNLQLNENSGSFTMSKINSTLSKNTTSNFPSNFSRKSSKLLEEIVKEKSNAVSAPECTITDSSTASAPTKEKENFIIDVTNRLSALQEVLKRPPAIKNDNPVFKKPSTIINIQKTTLKNRPDVLKLDTQQNVGTLPTEIDITDSSKENSKNMEKTAENQQLKNLQVLQTKQKNNHENFKSSVDDSTINLKEMLKEMKHSLSRTPKPKKIINNLSIIENNNIIRDKLSYRHEMNYAVVNNPPIVQFAHPKTSKNDFLSKKKHCIKTQKVSSGVQTSKDIIKINSQSINDEKTVDGLIKDTFALIKPSEFAAIRRGIKNTRKTDDTNPYVNITDQSLYANTVELSINKHKRFSNHCLEREKENKKNFPANSTDTAAILGQSNVNVDYFLKNPQSSGNNRKSTSIMAESMETLAVSELLQELEDAISSGKHKEAADCAKELARLKIQCSVKSHGQNRTNQSLNLNMFIEDRLAHQGPIPLQVGQKMTVLQLKEKIYAEYEIPPIIQHWIIGKNLLANDQATMEDLNVVEGSSIFLYLVAPDVQADNPARDVHREPKVNETKIQQGPEQIPPTIVDNFEAIPSCSKTEFQKNVEFLIESDLVTEKISVSPEKPSGPKEYEVLMMLENSGLVLNETEFECPICFLTYGQHEGVILRDCVHAFCRTCLEDTIKHCNDAEVKCPFRNDSYACESTLQEREIKSLVDKSIYEQHLLKSIAEAENNAGRNAFHCKTPDCPGWCICDDNVNHFLCPVCDMTNCLTCRVIHDGKNCWEYQEDMKAAMDTDYESKKTAEMIKEMLERGEAMNCPTCSVILMKKMGCDWLKCSMCKTEICWVTKGPRWGPGGPGDTTGGCQCRLNGAKCHPQCSYCH